MKNNIYIIDDNEEVGEALRFSFQAMCNLAVKVYPNPRLFLEEFSPDWRGCLIIDLFMPFLNGLELMKELKRRGSNMAVIIMSGHATETSADRSIKAGAHAFIAKPFNLETLFEKVNLILQTN